MNSVEMLYLNHQLSKANFTVHSLSYPSAKHDIAHNTQLLKQKLLALNLDSTYIVAHSLGGIMSMHLLALDGLPKIERIVLLGSPLNGSYIADKFMTWPLVNRLLKNSMGNGLDGNFTMPSMPYEIGMIAGVSDSLGVGTLVGGLPEESDGTVLLSETQHEILKEHIVVDKNHTGLLFSKDVADLTVSFLNTGSFQ
ncbi:hypothetical protein DKT75_18880 [Leucothrix arctica]|uniref:Alpha/beta hydrolase n=2 Tax=Leucothrix arctica TaxID=1481894 RepID=A0A317C5Z2_9GAMM|nr:hypothetical protein [Leucothrix arctica]PWQ93679.1 hypothetical protein DKT75_18880 [Leucothrix arctica]